MKKFKVHITEYLESDVEVEAETAEEAEEIAGDHYRNGGQFLDPDRYSGASFKAEEMKSERDCSDDRDR